MALKTITQIRLDNPTFTLAGSDLFALDQATRTIAATLSELKTFVRPADVTSTVNGLMLAADKAKLDAVAANATANATDAQLRDRTTHTGSQAIATVTGLAAALNTLTEDVFELAEASTEHAGTLTALDTRIDTLEATGAGFLLLKTFTLGTLPSAADNNRAIIEVSDATDGPTVCRSNGTAWMVLNTTTPVA